MAAIPATITINFTSNYAGPHRACWRIGASGPYDCTTIVNCTGGGNPCQAIISLTVDNESCNVVNFNGYMQATCESEGSTNGRDPFSTSFTPVPTCKSFTIDCNSVGVDSITLNFKGSGYDPMSPPAVTITGGGGSGATATATVGDGGIENIVSINAGSGYTDGTYTNVPSQNVTGSGSGATFDVAIISGSIAGITINTPGTGYVIGNNFTFNNSHFGGIGSGASYNVSVLNTGEVTAIVVTAAGSGYSTLATVTVDAPITSPGSRATGTAVMEQCGSYNLVRNCDTTDTPALTGFYLGQGITVCSPLNLVTHSPSQGYEVTPNDCCYDCVYLRVTKGAKGGTGTLIYTDCTTRRKVTLSITDNYDNSFCVVNHSWVVVEDPTTNSTSFSVSTTCP